MMGVVLLERKVSAPVPFVFTKKNCFKKVLNFPSAVVLGLKYIFFKQGKISKRQFTYLKTNLNRLERETTKFFSSLSYVNLTDYDVVSNIIHKRFGIGLVIFDKNCNNPSISSSPLYQSKNVLLDYSVDKRIVSLLRLDHENFFVIFIPNTFFGKHGSFCYNCQKTVKSLKTHVRCRSRCQRCDVPLQFHNRLLNQSQKSEDESSLMNDNTFHYCEKCNREFTSTDCYDLHLEYSTCGIFHVCNCGRKFRTIYKEEHICDLSRVCFQCKDHLTTFNQHFCYIKPISELPARDSLPKKVCFFDIESISTSETSPEFVHKPNLICASIFKLSTNSSDNNNLSTEETSRSYYKQTESWHSFGHDCIVEFCKKFILPSQKKTNTKKKKKRKSENIFEEEAEEEEEGEKGSEDDDDDDGYDQLLLVSHNGGRYDIHFIMHALCFTFKVYPKNVVQSGRKIFSIQYGTKSTWRRFIDSYNFIPIRLALFPEMFGLSESDCGKFYFPYLFNQVNNFNYEGPLPDRHYFGYSQMKKTQREQFNLWYEEATSKGIQFNFKKSLLEYCIQDVDLLAKGFLTYRDLFHQISGIDCFSSDITTLAGLCFKIWRFKFLKTKTLLNIGRARKGSNIWASTASITYLDYLNLSRPKDEQILHRDNSISGEIRIGRYSIDGFCPKTNTVFEYDSCLGHGCLCIQNRDRNVKLRVLSKNSATSLNERFERTKRKYEDLKKWGFNVEQIKVCNISIPKSDMNRLYVPRANYGMALFGGRSEAFLRYAKVGRGNVRSIKYGDFISLYPFCCTKKMPMGPMEIIRPRAEERLVSEEDIVKGKFFGLVHCLVLPPRDLFIPFLPVRSGDKTCFPLCAACLKQIDEDKGKKAIFVPEKIRIVTEHKPNCSSSCSNRSAVMVSVCPHN